MFKRPFHKEWKSCGRLNMFCFCHTKSFVQRIYVNETFKRYYLMISLIFTPPQKILLRSHQFGDLFLKHITCLFFENMLSTNFPGSIYVLVVFMKNKMRILKEKNYSESYSQMQIILGHFNI